MARVLWKLRSVRATRRSSSCQLPSHEARRKRASWSRILRRTRLTARRPRRSSRRAPRCAEKSQLEQDIATHKADREEAEKVIKESTAMRGKEAEEFAATSGDMKSNIQAMGG